MGRGVLPALEKQDVYFFKIGRVNFVSLKFAFKERVEKICMFI